MSPKLTSKIFPQKMYHVETTFKQIAKLMQFCLSDGGGCWFIKLEILVQYGLDLGLEKWKETLQKSRKVKMQPL